MLRAASIVLAAASLAFSAGCPGSLENKEDFEVEDTQPVVDPCNGLITKKCALSNCHDAESSSIDLTLEGREARIVDKPGTICAGNIIDTATPEASLMYVKCASPTQTCGAPMPLGTQGLGDEELSCLLGYIQSLGAGGASAGTGATTSSTGTATSTATSTASSGSAGGG